MNYALIKEGIVTNLIWLNGANASDFPDAVLTADRPVAIGDAFADGVFTRGGAPVLTPLEEAQAELLDMQAALALLGVTDNG